jgi:flagellin
MPTFINTNMNSLNVQMALNTSQSQQSSAMERLATGLKINSAADNAAGFAIVTRMTSQIGGDNQAAANANDGISLAQTAAGDLTQITNNLQTMRNLSVQSANATNSASDRAALNNQLQSLSAEIQRVSQTSQFNGVNLLDGSFTAQTFQIGANAGANDQIQIASIASASTSQLGSAGTTTQSTVVGTATTAALNAGDLTLNGAQVGASIAGGAPGQSTASASSIANAINAVQATSGVTATANSNSLTGTGGSVGAISANTFSINGINVGAIASGGNVQGQGANTAAALNLISTQTGVTAIANATTGAVTLTAADGRDIQINAGGAITNGLTQVQLTAAKASIASATGLNVSNINFGTSTAVSGAYTAGVSGTTSDLYKVNIDGISVFSGAADGTANNAAALQTAFNNFATANTGYRVAGTIAGGDLTVTKINGTAVSINTAFTNAAGTGPAAGPITTPPSTLFGDAAPTVATGVAGTTLAVAASTAGQNHGTVTLTSTSSAGIVIGGAADASAGLTAGTTAATTVSNVNSVANINISTAAGATAALSVIDGALAMVTASQAALGAVQNRFTSVVTSLQTTATNLTASQSRIQSTDYAAETANLSRAQILQQAGNAMLAQANQQPNQVMTLLR